MAYTHQSMNAVNQIAGNLYDKQSIFREKSNTVVTVIGFVLTALISGITYLVESGVSGVPQWLPSLVPFLGMLLTTLGVSKTKNGWTKSNLAQLDNAILEAIDTHQLDKVKPQIPEIYPPNVEKTSSSESHDNSNISEELDLAAKKLAHEDLR